MTRFGVHALVERTALRAQSAMPSLATKRVSPHSMRHSTATHLLRSGADINTVRAWLGHASLDTTNVYAEIDLEGKAHALAKCDVTNEREPKKRWVRQPRLDAVPALAVDGNLCGVQQAAARRSKALGATYAARPHYASNVVDHI